MNRRFRLRHTSDFSRVRNLGKSYTHPLLVLIVIQNDHETSRFGVAASRTIGKAVQRNRAKRLLRSSLHSYLGQIAPGWDILLIARRPMGTANFQQVNSALATLLQRAHLLKGLSIERSEPQTTG